ncbi:13370_t:CDS:2, partial [Gigaspora margarita]
NKSIRSYGKSESKGIEVKDGELTDSCKTLEAACITWKMKVKTFRNQVNTNKKKQVNKRSINEACKSWISKIPNKNVEPKLNQEEGQKLEIEKKQKKPWNSNGAYSTMSTSLLLPDDFVLNSSNLNSNVNNDADNDVIVEAEENDKTGNRGVEVNNNNETNIGADNKEQSEEANIEDENSSKVIDQ